MQRPVAGTVLDWDLHPQLLALTGKHPDTSCQTCSCHGGQGVLHHSDSTWQCEETEARKSAGQHVLQDAPAEHCQLHAELLDTPAEHTVVHATLAAGQPGAVYQKVAHTASPAWAPSLMAREQAVVLQLVGAQTAALSQGKSIEGIGAPQSRGHCLTLLQQAEHEAWKFCFHDGVDEISQEIWQCF